MDGYCGYFDLLNRVLTHVKMRFVSTFSAYKKNNSQSRILSEKMDKPKLYSVKNLSYVEST